MWIAGKNKSAVSFITIQLIPMAKGKTVKSAVSGKPMKDIGRKRSKGITSSNATALNQSDIYHYENVSEYDERMRVHKAETLLSTIHDETIL